MSILKKGMFEGRTWKGSGGGEVLTSWVAWAKVHGENRQVDDALKHERITMKETA